MIPWLVVTLLGLTVGSFLNVVIWRVPRQESILLPGSHCPHCGNQLAPRDLVPVVSYIVNRGRCRYCATLINWEYPVVELLTMALWLFLFHNFRFQTQFWVFAVFFALLIVLSFIDLHHGILPNAITFPGIAAGLLWGAANDLWKLVGSYPVHLLYNLGAYVSPFSLQSAIIGVIVGGGVVWLVVLLSKGGMGMGDVKLNAMIGAFLGWKAGFYNLFLAAVLGSVVGIFLLATGKKKRQDSISFGPYLALGAMILTLYRG